MSEHSPNCRWEKTTPDECAFRNTHNYCPHDEHACDCPPVIKMTKAEAVMQAIRETEVGSDIILHNEDMSIYCILTVKCKEHPEKKDEDGGNVSR